MGQKERKARYRARHHTKLLAENKKYRTEHRDKEKTRLKKYYTEHHDECRLRGKKYQAEHRDEIKVQKKQYQAKHRDEFRARRKQRTAALRQKCLSAYGRKCTCCGESNERFLTIDHANGDGAAHRKVIGKSGASTYRWLVKNDFPEGFQVLCWNCNLGRYLNGGICPHKETST